MLKRTLVTVLVICGASVPLSAELKYTVRLESHKAPAPAGPDPMLAMMGNVLLDNIVPGGSLEMTYTIGDKVACVEWNKAIAGIPAGAKLIKRQDGTTVIVNPADKTFWRVQIISLTSVPATLKPVIKKTSAGDATDIAGISANRSTVEITIPFPQAQAGDMVSGTPTELPMVGDVWISDKFKSYSSPATAPLIGLAILGFDMAPEGGFVMRQRLRGPMFGALELETTVLTMTEAPAAAGTFTVPDGYKEIPTPRAGG